MAGNGLLPVEAERQGKIVITTELGGGGVCPKQNHMLATRGVRNVLRHLGMLVDEPPTTRAVRCCTLYAKLSALINHSTEAMAAQELGLPPPAVVAAADREDYYPCNTAGFWEQAVDAGDDVVKGQLLGRVHFPTTPHLEPEEYFAHRDGYVIATRAITPTVRLPPPHTLLLLAKDCPHTLLLCRGLGMW